MWARVLCLCRSFSQFVYRNPIFLSCTRQWVVGATQFVPETHAHTTATGICRRFVAVRECALFGIYKTQRHFIAADCLINSFSFCKTENPKPSLNVFFNLNIHWICITKDHGINHFANIKQCVRHRRRRCLLPPLPRPPPSLGATLRICSNNEFFRKRVAYLDFGYTICRRAFLPFVYLFVDLVRCSPIQHRHSCFFVTNFRNVFHGLPAGRMGITFMHAGWLVRTCPCCARNAVKAFFFSLALPLFRHSQLAKMTNTNE